ncbi:SGNH/GDSL hydrolase family protein [Halobacillus karajensis]|uniref:SGNH/GDSL hydrolase family protein n=1 Tax=Halobacillus karajensis TaxID=195088 RepID=UPI00094593DA|nr:SGNH/GDSL hydrolase family protein [Halobacillus karajensis]
MKKIWMLMIVFIISVTPMQAHAFNEKRLVAIGDSIPYGYNLTKENKNPPKESFPYLIGMEKDMEVTNLSIPGLTSAQLLMAVRSNKIFRESLKEADYVIVYIGGNDLLNVVKKNGGLDGLKMEEAAPVIRDLIYNVYSTILEIDELTDGKILVYNIYNPYPAAGDKLSTPLAYINQQYASLIQLLKHFASVTLINAYKAYHDHPEYIIKGDVHPTEKGQRILAEITLKHLDE